MKRVRVAPMRGLVAEATDLSASACPVLFCDPDLYVADLNRAAAECASDLLGTDFREHLTPEGVVELKALIKTKSRASVLPVVRTHDFSYAVATATEYFGVVFAAVRLFQNRRSMMRDRDVRALICPEFDLPSSDADSGPALRDAMYMKSEISRIYDEVKDTPPEAVDLVRTARALLRKARDYGLDPSRCALSVPVSGRAVIPVFHDVTAVKAIAVAFSAAADLSLDGSLMMSIDTFGEDANIVIGARVEPGATRIVGDRHPELLGKEFPTVGVRGRILFYLCSVCGIGCAYTVDKGKRLKIVLTFRKGGIDICNVKHGDITDSALSGETEHLIMVARRLEGCAQR